MDQAVNENFPGPVPGSVTVKFEDTGPWVHLPEMAPLAMPVQDFAETIPLAAEPRRRGYWVPRAAIFVGAAVMTAAFAYELFSILALAMMTPLQFLFLVLSTIAFGWIAIGSLSGALGFLPLFAGERIDSIAVPDPVTPLSTRTALLFPVYHEDATRIAGTVEAMLEDIRGRGHAANFDVFILSDTRDGSDSLREARVYQALHEKWAGRAGIYYRRRLENHARKAGNIADWVGRFGAAYDHFIILDGDSVMSASTTLSLVQAMQRDPKAGLIQSVPRLVGGTTLLQRLQQFASNTYGPPVAAGLAAWHRDQGNYWGHNAIIRTVAFASAAGLPDLPGRKPFGGHIMSHDFVEAILLQRAGWSVHMMPSLDGTYEGMPPNIADVVVRDRRWAQGNLQHLAIVSQPGITAMGRVHLGMGATSYLISAVWAASLIVGLILALQGQQMIPSYFRDAKTLFPIWPVIDPGAALRLFLATLVVVLLPKGLGLLLEWRRAREMRAPLHALRSTIGVTFETIFSMLIAPILMVTQTVASIQIFIGIDSGWKAQRRDDGALRFKDAMAFARWHTLIGIAAAMIAYAASPGLLMWMSPVILGLVLAGPVSWFTSRPAGAFARWALSTTEDRTPPSILVAANARSAEWARNLPQLEADVALPRAA